MHFIHVTSTYRATRFAFWWIHIPIGKFQIAADNQNGEECRRGCLFGLLLERFVHAELPFLSQGSLVRIMLYSDQSYKLAEAHELSGLSNLWREIKSS